MEEQKQPDYMKLAKEAFKRENILIKLLPVVRATLLQGENVVADGQATVSDGFVTFNPEHTKALGILNEPITLKEEKSGKVIPLSQSQELLELNSEMTWFFNQKK